MALAINLLKAGRPLSALFKSQTPQDVWQEHIDGARQDELACATIVDLSIPSDVGLPYQSLAFCTTRQLSLT